MDERVLLDFEWYAANVLKIQTKIDGIRPFKLRKIQKKYLQHLKEDFPSGIIRSIVLKPRQSGFSTLIAGINTHKMWMHYDQKGIMLADKLNRTQEIFSIYDTFRKTVDPIMLPAKHPEDIINSREMYFENRRSGMKCETQNDPNAGRSGSRRWAHLSEFAFFTNADSIDEGVQNSIPIARGTRIFKESTAYGVSGAGRAFYEQWNAAVRGESIYRPFFVAWYEVEDYEAMPEKGFVLTSAEKDIMRMHKDVSIENIAWRRLMLKSYSNSTLQIFTPEERFAQDFPLFPEQAFLFSGRPVFEQQKIMVHIQEMKEAPPKVVNVNIERPNLKMFPTMLKVFNTPIENEKYVIGADTAEGLATGDANSAFIINSKGEQVALFHGRIDPDIFGKILVELAKVYNNAMLVPEINNTGYATVAAIKNEGYYKIYNRETFDELGLETNDKLGWRTTRSNKQMMLSRLIAMYRDGEVMIKDINLLQEMAGLTRESNGDVELNGQDRTVAACLACMGLDQVYEEALVYNSNIKQKLHFETYDKSREAAKTVVRHED